MFNLRLDRPVDKQVKVHLRLVHIDTGKNDFYPGDESWVEVFEPGSDTDRGISVPTIRDARVEGVEKFRVEITNVSSNAQIGKQGSVTVELQDIGKPKDAALVPSSATVTAIGGNILFRPGKNTQEMRIIFKDQAGSYKQLTYMQFDQQWDEFSSVPPGTTFDKNTGQVSVPLAVFQAGSEIGVWSGGPGARWDRFENVDLVQLDGQGGVRPLSMAREAAALFASSEEFSAGQWNDSDVFMLDRETVLDYRAAQDEIGNGDQLRQLQGDAGDNVLIAADAPSWLAGGDGRDSFVFLMDRSEQLPLEGVDTIADFNKTDDRIVLVSPEASPLSLENIQFREDVQQLSIQWQYGDSSHTHSVEIRSHDGQLLSEMEILKAVQIL